MSQSPDTRRLGEEWSKAIEKLVAESRSEEMKDAIKEIFPPDVPPIVRWRLAIFIVCAFFLLFIGWSISPWGFARAEEMRDLQIAQIDIRLSLIEQKVYTAKESECSATDRDARRFFSERVLELVREYRRLAGANLDIPPCPSGKIAGDL